jgi:hypothetical protein
MDSMREDNEQRPVEVRTERPVVDDEMDRYEAPAPRRGRGTHSRERSRDLPYKSPALAACLSMMPGLGQIYVGYYQRGFVHLGILAGLITVLSSGDIGGLEPLFGISLSFFWFYNIIDAYRRASLYNRALDGIEGIKMPEDFEMPEGGSTAGGVVLIIIGVLLLFHTKFDMDMNWLAEWWPLGAIALGVWLIYKARQGKA